MNYYTQKRDKTKQLSNSFLLKQKKKKKTLSLSQNQV